MVSSDAIERWSLSPISSFEVAEMDNSSITSVVLFDALQRDLGIVADCGGTRFHPFPYGLPSGLSPREYAGYALLSSVFKKTEIESAIDAESQSYGKFCTANDFCGLQSLEAFLNDERVSSPPVGMAISHAKQLLYAWFKIYADDCVLSQATIEVAAHFGPGRSVGLKKQPSLLYFKVGDSEQTATTPFIIDWYERSVSFNPVCEAAEMARKARHGNATVVEHGNLTFVPKSYTAKRAVVTEPSLNTFFQLGVGTLMERVLASIGIDLTNQSSMNAELARIGSLTGEYATMDLTQCSDYISTALIEYLLPPSVVNWLKLLRTPAVRMKDGEILPLNMFMTMGNGFTFPLQTLILSALVLGVYDVHDIPLKNEGGTKAWGVFGDDICVTRDAYHPLSKVLTTLGMMVNHEKSFYTGDFRESCGSDWYQGQNVRGVYLKKYTSDQDLYSAFNRLAMWSAKNSIELKETLGTILAILTSRAVIPPDETEDGGLWSPTPVSEPDENGIWQYGVYKRKLSSLRFEMWETFEFGGLPQGEREWKNFSRWLSGLLAFCGGSVNEPALLKVLLAGGLRRKTMVSRDTGIPSYRYLVRTTPRWGFSPRDTYPAMGSDEFNRLDSLVRGVLAGL
jgi:hypothetical protein